MTNITTIKFTHKTIWQLLFITYVIVLPFGTALINIVFVTIVIFWFLELITKKIVFSKRDVLLVLIFSSFYLLNLISIVYSQNFDYAIKKLILQSYIFITPIVLISKKDLITKHFFSKLISWFSISLFTLGFLSLVNQAIKYLKGNNRFYECFFQNDLSTSIVDYYFLGLSLSISFALIANIYIKNSNEHSFTKVYNKGFYVINSFLFLILILLNSRSLIILTVFFVGWLVLVKAIKKKRYKGALIFFSFLAIISIFNFQFNKVFNEKIKEAIGNEVKNNNEAYWGGKGMRYLIWDCAIKVINENKLLGTGIGDQQDELTLCYKIYMRDQLLYNKDSPKNAHNIFLQIGISSGILGMILFAFSFIYPLILKIRTNSIYIYFSLLFLIAGFTESFLERNVSVAFFSFFNVLCFLIPNDEDIYLSKDHQKEKELTH